MSTLQRQSIIRVLFVCFHDMLTYAMLSPVLVLLFLDSSCCLLAPDNKIKHFVFGLYLSIYSLMQICSLPLWAKASHFLSKKNILKLSYLGNSCGYLIGALGIHLHQIVFLFIGAGLAGLMGANLATTHAIIAQNAPRHQWMRLYSLLGAIIGAAFIIGPQITGFGLSTLPMQVVCFWIFVVCAAVSLGNFLLVGYLPAEGKFRRGFRPLALGFFSTSIVRTFSREVRQILLFQFCVYLGWYCFIKFFQVYLLETLGCSDVWSCYGISYLGLCCMIWQGVRFSSANRRFAFKYSLHLALIMMGGSFAAFLVVESVFAVGIAVFCLACSYAMIVPSALAILIGSGEMRTEYKTSAYHSVQALAKIVGPLTAGLVLSFTSYGTALICTVLVAVAGVIVGRNPQVFRVD